MIERDDNIPPLAELLQELAHTRHIGETALEDKTHSLENSVASEKIV